MQLGLTGQSSALLKGLGYKIPVGFWGVKFGRIGFIGLVGWACWGGIIKQRINYFFD